MEECRNLYWNLEAKTVNKDDFIMLFWLYSEPHGEVLKCNCVLASVQNVEIQISTGTFQSIMRMSLKLPVRH